MLTNPVSHWDLTTAAVGAPSTASDPAAYYSAGSNTKHVIYRSADGHLNDIWWVPEAFYDSQRARNKGHHTAVRALAYKWIRILYACWKSRT